jgi:hypothetical protein
MTMWATVYAWFKHSLTIFWARVQVLAGVTGALLFGLIQDPNISGALQSLLKPDYIPYYIIAIGLFTELARRRTVGKATDQNNHVVES